MPARPPPGSSETRGHPQVGHAVARQHVHAAALRMEAVPPDSLDHDHAGPGRVRHPGRETCRAALALDRRSEEHTSELQSRLHLVCRLLLEKKKHAGLRYTYDRHDPVLYARLLLGAGSYL